MGIPPRMDGEHWLPSGGIAEVPRLCPAGHRDPDGNPVMTPAWGQCDRCGEPGRQWRCQEPQCGRTLQHDHTCRV